ncbi:fumarate hydratase [bacterium]|nr:fumarate hydratase [bacterium]
MRIIPREVIVEKVADLCFKAAVDLPDDVYRAIKRAGEREESPIGKSILVNLVKNADIARQERVPICQDTGVAVYFVEIGTSVDMSQWDIYEVLEEATTLGYTRGYLRLSVARDPLEDRSNSKTNGPPVVHLKLVPGDKLKITLAPKGGGSENMSALAMLKPLAGKEGVINFVIDTVRKAGGNPCPPCIIGLGLGGNFEMAPFLAKKALLREVGERHPNPYYAQFETEILEKVNASGIGPGGLGGSTTALDVHIETYPCHIASLPAAVNLNCHAARHASIEI